MDRYLVTGGGGFVGSALVRALVEAGNRPRVLDNFSTGRRENLANVLDRIEVIEGDVRDPAVAARACQGITFVLHEAAIPSVPRSLRDPVSSNEANVGGTLSILLAARDAGVRRLVYAGSSSAYGNTPGQPRLESMPTAPISPYAVSKLAGELYCQTFTHNFGLETVVLRYFNVFGPRQDPNSPYSAVMPRMVSALLKGEAPVIYGDGKQSRDFTYVDNVVSANLLACIAPKAAGQVINVACGQTTSLLELHKLLCNIIGAQVTPRHEPGRIGDVHTSLASIQKAMDLLSYAPLVTLEDGLRKLVEWTVGKQRGTSEETSR